MFKMANLLINRRYAPGPSWSEFPPKNSSEKSEATYASIYTNILT